MKRIDHNYVQVYKVEVYGRSKEDSEQHFPIDSKLVTDGWHTDLYKAVEEFKSVKICDCKKDENYMLSYSDIYQDYIVQLFSLDININEFETVTGLVFDLKYYDIQEALEYYVDFKFNTVAERIDDFIEDEDKNIKSIPVLHAREAKKLSSSHHLIEFEDIMLKIHETAKYKGLTFIEVNGKLKNETTEKLRELGYRVDFRVSKINNHITKSTLIDW